MNGEAGVEIGQWALLGMATAAAVAGWRLWFYPGGPVRRDLAPLRRDLARNRVPRWAAALQEHRQTDAQSLAEAARRPFAPLLADADETINSLQHPERDAIRMLGQPSERRPAALSPT